jgi:hypothetical protein
VGAAWGDHAGALGQVQLPGRLLVPTCQVQSHCLSGSQLSASPI